MKTFLIRSRRRKFISATFKWFPFIINSNIIWNQETLCLVRSAQFCCKTGLTFHGPSGRIWTIVAVRARNTESKTGTITTRITCNDVVTIKTLVSKWTVDTSFISPEKTRTNRTIVTVEMAVRGVSFVRAWMKCKSTILKIFLTAKTRGTYFAFAFTQVSTDQRSLAAND